MFQISRSNQSGMFRLSQLSLQTKKLSKILFDGSCVSNDLTSYVMCNNYLISRSKIDEQIFNTQIKSNKSKIVFKNPLKLTQCLFYFAWH